MGDPLLLKINLMLLRLTVDKKEIRDFSKFCSATSVIRKATDASVGGLFLIAQWS